MTVSVRVATEADIDTLVRLCQLVQSLHAEWFPGEFLPSIENEGLKKLLERSLASIGVAELDGAPVGYVLFEVQSIPATPLNFAIEQVFIHHLSVAVEARRKGVAAALMDYVRRHAQERGISQLALARAAPNVAAQRFFEAQGFTNRHIFMQMTLNDKS